MILYLKDPVIIMLQTMWIVFKDIKFNQIYKISIKETNFMNNLGDN